MPERWSSPTAPHNSREMPPRLRTAHRVERMSQGRGVKIASALANLYPFGSVHEEQPFKDVGAPEFWISVWLASPLIVVGSGRRVRSASVTSRQLFSNPVQRFSNRLAGSEPFRKFPTLLLFAVGYKSVDMIRSAWKRFVLIVQPLRFHDSPADPTDP
jgi:hypothetical protein